MRFSFMVNGSGQLNSSNTESMKSLFNTFSDWFCRRKSFGTMPLTILADQFTFFNLLDILWYILNSRLQYVSYFWTAREIYPRICFGVCDLGATPVNCSKPSCLLCSVVQLKKQYYLLRKPVHDHDLPLDQLISSSSWSSSVPSSLLFPPPNQLHDSCRQNYNVGSIVTHSELMPGSRGRNWSQRYLFVCVIHFAPGFQQEPQMGYKSPKMHKSIFFLFFIVNWITFYFTNLCFKKAQKGYKCPLYLFNLILVILTSTYDESSK